MRQYCAQRLSTTAPLRRQKEYYWIRELGTAIPYGWNDKIDGIYGILSSHTSRSVNVMDIFNSDPRRKRSQSYRHYTSPILQDVSLNHLLQFMQKPLGMYHIRSILFSLPLSKLYMPCTTHVTNLNSNEYKFAAIVLDIAGHKTFQTDWH